MSSKKRHKMIRRMFAGREDHWIIDPLEGAMPEDLERLLTAPPSEVTSSAHAAERKEQRSKAWSENVRRHVDDDFAELPPLEDF